MHQTLVILDYGSQYTQLITRRARELGVFSIILPYKITAAEVRKHNPHGIILSGGPSSVHDYKAPQLDPGILELGVPILGICYGLQLLATKLGGKVEPGINREYGKATIQRTGDSQLIYNGFDASTVWMSHGDHVTVPPPNFTVTAKSGEIICAIENTSNNIFGLQFHPEVTHSQYGRLILENFIDLCKFSRDWKASSIIKEQTAHIRKLVGNRRAICGLSGGVDSSVAATIVNQAIGAQQTCIFVDTGLLRSNEYDEILAQYQAIGLRVVPVRAGDQFLPKLRGITNPEQKRKIIGAEFIRVFETQAKKLDKVDFLVQGTLYPDVIESISVNGPSVTIKSHHNVGGLPKRMRLRLIEPLRELFKDEVRQIGAQLGLPNEITQRQPFPGPGLGIRIIGQITPARIALLQKADAIVRAEIEQHKIHTQLWQFFAILLPIKSVGVMGDGRTYEQAIAIRAVTSIDGMTADWALLPHELLARISSRIVAEIRGVNRVVYDITSKPPSTIEWE